MVSEAVVSMDGKREAKKGEGGRSASGGRKVRRREGQLRRRDLRRLPLPYIVVPLQNTPCEALSATFSVSLRVFTTSSRTGVGKLGG